MDEMISIFITSATIVVIIIAVSAFIRSKYFKSNKPEKIIEKSEFNYKGFVEALGGIQNIIEVDFHQSRLILKLNDYSLFKQDVIKSYKASGIVKTSKSLTIVLGSRAESVTKYITQKQKDK